jgi:bacillithiol system protein YtxJ
MSQTDSSSENGFVELRDSEALDSFLIQSNGAPVIIFKHSNTCGISARAYAEMSKLDHPIGLVVVQQARGVSDEIESRTGVEHHTPQVFILRDGRVVWNASHGQIKAEAVEAALSANQ